MKNIKILLASAIIAAFTLTSCSKDDNTVAAPVVPVVLEAKWTPVKTVVTVGTSDQNQPYDDNVATCDKNYLEFTTTTANFIVYYKNATGVCQQDTPNTATYVKSGNNLIVTGGKYNGTYTIATLTASELIIKSVATQSGTQITTTTYFTKVAVI